MMSWLTLGSAWLALPMAPAGKPVIYIASPEGDTGKSTIALGILARLAATVAKVGVFRPIARSGETAATTS